jgi:hypothetical protein
VRQLLSDQGQGLRPATAAWHLPEAGIHSVETLCTVWLYCLLSLLLLLLLLLLGLSLLVS